MSLEWNDRIPNLDYADMPPALGPITISVHWWLHLRAECFLFPHSSSSLKQENLRVQQNKLPFPAELYLL